MVNSPNIYLTTGEHIECAQNIIFLAKDKVCSINYKKQVNNAKKMGYYVTKRSHTAHLTPFIPIHEDYKYIDTSNVTYV